MKREQSIKMLSMDDFADKDPLKYGLNGSPTQVERIFPPEVKTQKRLAQGPPAALAGDLIHVLNEYRLI